MAEMFQCSNWDRSKLNKYKVNYLWNKKLGYYTLCFTYQKEKEQCFPIQIYIPHTYILVIF